MKGEGAGERERENEKVIERGGYRLHVQSVLMYAIDMRV